MISITGSGDKPLRLKRGWAAVLRLRFDDIKRPVNGGILFDDALADRVIDFLERIEGKVDHVIVHCNRSMSRGPAVARYITAACDLDNGFQSHRTFNRHVFRTLFWRWRHRVAPGQGGCWDMGFLEADDPIYRMGVMVAGRPLTLTKPEKEE